MQREERASVQERGGETGRETEKPARERERTLWLLFLCVCVLFCFVFLYPLGLPYANWAQAGGLFYLKSSLWSSDLSLTFLCSIFVGFSLPCLLATTLGTPFPYSNYLTFPPQEMGGPILWE